MYLAKTIRWAATFSLYLWTTISILRIIKHVYILFTEPSLYAPPINDHPDYQYFLHRFLSL